MKKKVNKKLVFQKVIICKLTDSEMSDINGANYLNPTVSWVLCCQTADTKPTGEAE